MVVYEVQPPQGTQWFGDKAEVDAMVEKLWEGDYELDASFGTSQVTEVTNPVTVLYTSAPSDNGDDNLLLVIAAFASALVVLVGVAVTTVLYYRRRALRRSFNNRAAAAVNEVESLDGHETRALYAVRPTHVQHSRAPPCCVAPYTPSSLAWCALRTLGHLFKARLRQLEMDMGGHGGGIGGIAVAHSQQQQEPRCRQGAPNTRALRRGGRSHLAEARG